MADNSSGALTEQVYYLLLALHRPMHGYAIMQYVAQLSAGRINLGPGTLYGALNTLAERGWIAPTGDPSGRTKEYLITDMGRRIVADELLRLQELLENGTRITGGNAQ